MKRFIVMLGTGLDTMGGVSAVVNVYREAGLFERQPLCYLATHGDVSKLRKIWLVLKAWPWYLWMLLSGRITLVHAHVASRASFWRKSLFLLPAIWLRCPTIFHLHGGGFRTFFEVECGPLRRRIVRYVLDHCSAIVVLSSGWQRWVRSISRNQQVEVIFNPVVLPALDTVSEQGSVVLMLGRLCRDKGSYDLLEAIAQLHGKGLQCRLRLGGDGELEQISQYATRLAIAPQVDVLGWVVGDAKLAELRRAAVYALPSYAEGLPMSILEAMAMGLPIVATPVGGIPEAITDGVEGFLVAPGDVQALARRLEQLLCDSTLRQRMGSAARERVAHTFSVDVVLPSVERLYASLRQILSPS